jgi:hypothetical protein
MPHMIQVQQLPRRILIKGIRGTTTYKVLASLSTQVPVHENISRFAKEAALWSSRTAQNISAQNQKNLSD